MNTGSTTAETGAARFSRHVAWTIAAKIAIAASSLLSGIIVARWLGAGAVGVLGTLSVITMLAVNVGGLGLPSSITFLIARDRLKARSVFLNAVIFALISGPLLAAAMIVAANLRPDLLGDVPPALLIVVAFALPVQMLTAFSAAAYLGLERIRAYNLIDLTLQGIILTNTLVTVVALGFGLNALVVLGVAANVAVGLTITLALGSDPELRSGEAHWGGALLREMIATGLRFFVAMAAGLVIFRADLLIVNCFRGSAEAGVYAVSTQAATFLQMMPSVISTLLFPRAAGAQDETGEMTCRVTRHATFIMFVMCVAAVPAAFLLPILFGPAFSAAPKQVLVLLPGVFLLGIETVQVQYFSGLGLPRLIAVFWLVTLAVNITLNVILVPSFGAEAAAAVSSISYALIFALVCGYFLYKTRRSFAEVFIIRGSELAALLKSFDLLATREGKA